MKKDIQRLFAVQARRALTDAAGSFTGSRSEAESTAFGWFFRLVSLRYLEVNAPAQWQVFAGLSGTAEAEAVLRGRLAACCKRLHEAYPAAFPEPDFYGRISCLPEQFYGKNAPVSLLLEIPDSEWRENIPICGRLYQYYNSEEKAMLPASRKRNQKVSAAQIHAATQLFTPDWIVRCLTENLLGIYCRDRSDLLYCIRDRADSAEECDPLTLTFMDPCMGSGNMLTAAFDLLLRIYREHGFSVQDAALRIPQQNLCGLDIDPRAYRLTAFALLMKVRQICPDADLSGIHLRIAHFHDTGSPETGHAAQLGSLLRPSADSREFRILSETLPAAAELLSQQYDIVCTNPPYMNRSSMNDVLSAFIRRYYPDYSADLFSAFTVRCMELTKPGGRIGLLIPYVWMFIRSYEKLRERIDRTQSVETLVQFAYSVFRDATVPLCAFTLRNLKTDRPGIYIRLSDFASTVSLQQKQLLAAAADSSCKWRYSVQSSHFRNLPGKPFAYWLHDALCSAFIRGTPLGALADVRQGLATGCNARFLRCWYEVAADAVCKNASCAEDAAASGKKWFPYNKGGDYRKWYGNDLYVVNWERDGREIRNFRNEKGMLRSRPQNTAYYFQPSVSWSLVSSSDAAFRLKPAGQIFDVSGMSFFGTENRLYLLALCNSAPAKEMLKAIAPTINYQCGDIAALPVIFPETNAEKLEIEALTEENIALCKADWDSFEISMDFQRHPLIPAEPDVTL